MYNFVSCLKNLSTYYLPIHVCLYVAVVVVYQLSLSGCLSSSLFLLNENFELFSFKYDNISREIFTQITYYVKSFPFF